MLCVVTMTNVDFLVNKLKEINLPGTKKEDTRDKELAEMEKK